MPCTLYTPSILFYGIIWEFPNSTKYTPPPLLGTLLALKDCSFSVILLPHDPNGQTAGPKVSIQYEICANFFSTTQPNQHVVFQKQDLFSGKTLDSPFSLLSTHGFDLHLFLDTQAFPKLYFQKCIFQKCLFQKCIFQKCIFPKCTRLTQLLSFASLLILESVLYCNNSCT